MKKSFTLKELATLVQADFIGDKDYIVCGINTLDEAKEDEVSFLANSRYLDAMKKSKAGVICTTSALLSTNCNNYLLSNDPSYTFQKVAQIILSAQDKTGFEGYHSSAIIHESASLGENITISPYAVIDKNSQIGANTFIGPFVYIGPQVTIGSGCYIHSHSCIRERCILGERVILQPGAVIGSCGFGYTQDEKGKNIKLEQLGIVIIEDDVEIGANTTIDRARFKATIIHNGAKIDNLVQVAHNTEIGEDNIIAAQTGIAGSVKTGKGVILGGQSGVQGHIELADYVMVAAKAGVSKSLQSGRYRGVPAIDLNEYNRTNVHVRRLEKYVNLIKSLEKKVERLEESLKEK